MVKFYVFLIQCGELKIDDVPQYWRKMVENALTKKNNTEDRE